MPLLFKHAATSHLGAQLLYNCVALAYLKGILSQKIENFAFALHKKWSFPLRISSLFVHCRENLYSRKIANLVFYKNWHLQNNQKQILKASSELVHAKTSRLKRGILKYLP